MPVVENMPDITMQAKIEELRKRSSEVMLGGGADNSKSSARRES